MAEERLIDEDKDRKYKIRKNADGEDELYIDDSAEEEEEQQPVFDVPDFEGDDEEAAYLTPEQLAERERLRKEEEKLVAERLASLTAEAREKIDGGDFEGALYAVRQAEETGGESGELSCLKLRAVTRNLTDFSSSEECAEAADAVKEYADESLKAELKADFTYLQECMNKAKSEADALSEENEAKKSERRPAFLAKRRRAVRFFSFTAVPFVLFLILAVSFVPVMFSDEDGQYLILTAVFAALAVIALICTLVTARKLWEAQRNVLLNERDTATKLGREYLEKKSEYELLLRIYSATDEKK